MKFVAPKAVYADIQITSSSIQIFSLPAGSSSIGCT